MTPDLSRNPEISAYTTAPMHLLCINYRGELRCFTPKGCFWAYSKCSEIVSKLFVFWQFSPNFMTPDLSQNPEIDVYIKNPIYLVCVTYHGLLRCFAPQGCFWSYSKCSKWVFNTFCFVIIFTNFHDPGPVARSKNLCVYNNSYAPVMHHLLLTVEMFHSHRVLLITFEVFLMSFNPVYFLTIFTKFHDPGPVAKSKNLCVYDNSYAPAIHHLSWTLQMFHSPTVLLIIFEVFWMSFNTFVFWEFSPNSMTPELSRNPEICAYI